MTKTATTTPLRKGFGASTQPQRFASYWIAAYSKDNEDEPLFLSKERIEHVPGQNVERLMLLYCHSLLNEKPDIWEVLVHQGPDGIPQSGDQIVARLSREPFEHSEILSI